MMPFVLSDDALVIFDCDGVLVDSEPVALRIDLILLAEVGLEMSEARRCSPSCARSQA